MCFFVCELHQVCVSASVSVGVVIFVVCCVSGQARMAPAYHRPVGISPTPQLPNQLGPTCSARVKRDTDAGLPGTVQTPLGQIGCNIKQECITVVMFAHSRKVLVPALYQRGGTPCGVPERGRHQRWTVAGGGTSRMHASTARCAAKKLHRRALMHLGWSFDPRVQRTVLVMWRPPSSLWPSFCRYPAQPPDRLRPQAPTHNVTTFNLQHFQQHLQHTLRQTNLPTPFPRSLIASVAHVAGWASRRSLQASLLVAGVSRITLDV